MKTAINFRYILFPALAMVFLPLVSLADPLPDGSRRVLNSTALDSTPTQIVSRIEESTSEHIAVPVDVGSTRFISALPRPSDEYSRNLELLKDEFREFKHDLQCEQDWFLGKLNLSLVAIAIAVALIGIVIPIMNTKRQNDKLRDELLSLRKKNDKELANLRTDVLGSIHLCLSENITALNAMASTSELDVAMILTSVVLCFDDLIEAAARTNDGEILEREVKAFKPFLERWSNSEILQRIKVWSVAKGMIEKGMRKKKRELSRKDFVRLLGDHSEVFDWLKKLYADFAEWRFE